MRSLYWKLGAAMLFIVVVSVGLTAYLANLSTGREFETYMQQGTTMYTRNVSAGVSEYYAQSKDWSGVQDVLIGLLRYSGDRLLVANSAGVIVGDTGQVWLNKNSVDAGLSGGTPVLSSGQNVGTLYLLTTGSGGGKGYMGGRGGSSPMMTTTPEQTFLAGINRSLIVVGLIAAAVALILGLFLTRQILKPVKALSLGASRIASGALKYRVEVQSKDEIGNLAQSFNSMASSLERGEEARRQLNADIAHELRTPLTIIEGTVDGILDGVFQPDPDRLNVIKQQTESLTHLINDLRDLSLIESGQLKLELKPVDMAELVQHKISQIEAPAHEKGIQLEFNAADALPMVMADPVRMEQVISNLLTNAIRHTPRGGTITFSVTRQDNGVNERVTGHQLLISVKDTGEGIPPENLPHIFERFYRVDNSRARSEGGTGLGLAIVKQIVDAHGGKVRAESQIGKGSTFYVALPVQSPK
jgi:signal transduction histidine kinase